MEEEDKTKEDYSICEKYGIKLKSSSPDQYAIRSGPDTLSMESGFDPQYRMISFIYED
ncbi:MAG: hypothetical protein KJ623_01230 [Nanoarchaeota archaeon]|nr:hypothetical protein [Nanoarchaeota archaeon]MBU0962738.1 hypothetical protein [Nanoarchaeota archaeon]